MKHRLMASALTVALAVLAWPASEASAQRRPAGGPIRVGQHQCQISEEYRFRPCRITAIGRGRYEIVFPNGLLGVRGTLVPSGGGTYQFTGSLTDDVPFMCGYGRRELPDYASDFQRCRDQAVRATMRRTGNGWVGQIPLVALRTHYVGDTPPGVPRTPVSHSIEPYESGTLRFTIVN